MAKGAGMLAPAAGHHARACSPPTPTVDAADRWTGRCAPRPGSRFDRLDSDGCMSTNDTVTLLASGASGITPTAEDFTEALDRACTDLAHAAAGRRRGRRPRDRHRRARRRHRGRRGRGRPLGRAQQPVQGRGLRQGPQLGPGAGLDRHHGRRVRPGRPRRRDERRLGLPRVARPTRTRPRSDLERPGGQRDHRPEGRRRARATVWTNDLTHAYVHENSAYSS